MLYITRRPLIVQLRVGICSALRTCDVINRAIDALFTTNMGPAQTCISGARAGGDRNHKLLRAENLNTYTCHIRNGVSHPVPRPTLPSKEIIHISLPLLSPDVLSARCLFSLALLDPFSRPSFISPGYTSRFSSGNPALPLHSH